jgi:3-deoxy-D-manno-octulosonic-acid transferase
MNAAAAVYRGLTALAEPLAGPALSVFAPGEGRALHRERLGRGPLDPVQTWWHAASLGEVAALEPVLERARARSLAGTFLVTTTSRTGRERARRIWPERARLAPLDTPRVLSRTLDGRRPAAVLFVETELWPNWVRMAAERGIPMGIVNGRVSDRSWPRYRKWRGVLRPLLARLEAVAARYETDAERFLALGARPHTVRVAGNTKHDRLLAAEPASLPWSGVTLWTAGSIRPGEEAAVLDAFRDLRPRFPRLRLALVPRHPVAMRTALDRALESRGLRAALRSAPAPEDAAADVLIVDGQGALPRFYAAAAVVFVGGTLVDKGGHNVLEAAQFGVPVVTGPHLANVREDGAALERAGGLVRVTSGPALRDAVEAWLANPREREDAGRRAAAVATASRGAAERTLDWMLERGVLRPVEPRG